MSGGGCSGSNLHTILLFKLLMHAGHLPLPLRDMFGPNTSRLDMIAMDRFVDILSSAGFEEKEAEEAFEAIAGVGGDMITLQVGGGDVDLGLMKSIGHEGI